MFKALPVIMFSYTSQVNVFQIQSELERTSEASIIIYLIFLFFIGMKKVTVRSLGISFVAYLFIGCFGYISYTSDTAGNLFTNLTIPKNGPVLLTILISIYLFFLFFLFLFLIFIVLAYVGMALAVVMAYPLNIFPMRYSILSMILGVEKVENQYETFPTRFAVFHYSLSLLLVGLSLMIALFVNKLDLVFQVTGGTTSSLLCFIMPGLYIIKLYHMKVEEYNIYFLLFLFLLLLFRISLGHEIGAILMVVIGAVIGVWSTYVSIAK